MNAAKAFQGTCLALVVATLVVTPAAVAQEDKLPPAEKILEMTLKAQGGREMLEAKQSRILKGKFLIEVSGQSQEFTVERYEQAPNLFYLEIDLGGQKIKAGSNGSVYWDVQPGSGASVDEGDEKTVSARRARFYKQLYWKEDFPTVETVGKVDLDGRSCYKVQLTPEVGSPITHYYDRKTGLPAQTESVRDTDGETITIVDKLEDYREVDGVKLPFRRVRLVTSEGTPPRTFTYAWTSIEHNVTIPEKKFRLPVAVRLKAETAEIREKGSQEKSGD